MVPALVLVVAALLSLPSVMASFISPPVFAQAAAPAAAAPLLDYETFKTRVQPILLATRTGSARCAACHARAAAVTWSPCRREARRTRRISRAATSSACRGWWCRENR